MGGIKLMADLIIYSFQLNFQIILQVPGNLFTPNEQHQSLGLLTGTSPLGRSKVSLKEQFSPEID